MHQQPYYKLIIFIRHGQYHLNKKKPEEKILTDIGWQQAYATGCRLKEMGIKIDRIIHSDLIRARQTTAGILIGLQDNIDCLFDASKIVQLVNPDPFKVTDSKLCTKLQDVDQVKNVSCSSVNLQMIDNPYSPYIDAKFDCQLSRFLNEGPPPVAPIPSTHSSKKSDNIRSKEGVRIDYGFQVHLNRQPITKSGVIACNGPDSCPIECCPETNRTTTAAAGNGGRGNGDNSSNSIIIKCDCPCHRISQHKPIETIVFIGHANVFRYWICKVLQLPCEAWLRLSLGHGSISTLIITNDECLMTSRGSDDDDDDDNTNSSCREEMTMSKLGSVVTLCRFGDVGHLPPNLLTHNSIADFLLFRPDDVINRNFTIKVLCKRSFSILHKCKL
ncbi:unnamed protein product [Heterobilharzia americana]|nr:unnamed protein product [Heterobilharzia americana]